MDSDAIPAGRRIDFFVSHAGRDQAWAEWLAWQLIEAGYTVELDVWEWTPGEDFVARMERALTRADRVLAVWSEAYFRSTFAGAELRAAFARQAREAGPIVPVLVEPASVPDLYASLLYVDLVGLDEAAAAARLRARLVGGPPRTPPPFPAVGPRAAGKPAFAGRLLTVWNVPLRNPHFVGRTELLSELRGGCVPVSTRSRCRRCTGWAAWARLSWRSSTPTGSPPTTSWSGGSTPSSARWSRASSPRWPARWVSQPETACRWR